MVRLPEYGKTGSGESPGHVNPDYTPWASSRNWPSTPRSLESKLGTGEAGTHHPRPGALRVALNDALDFRSCPSYAIIELVRFREDQGTLRPLGSAGCREA